MKPDVKSTSADPSDAMPGFAHHADRNLMRSSAVFVGFSSGKKWPPLWPSSSEPASRGATLPSHVKLRRLVLVMLVFDIA
jgi:hypothetical protein